jgi:hypothetical protein
LLAGEYHALQCVVKKIERDLGQAWDLSEDGAQSSALRNHAWNSTCLLVFVVDSSDRGQMRSAQCVLPDHVGNWVLLVLLPLATAADGVAVAVAVTVDRRALARLLDDEELLNCPLLVIANKQDLPADQILSQ